MKQDTDTQTIELPVDRREEPAKVPAVRSRRQPAAVSQPQTVAAQPTTPMDLLRLAMERNMAPEQLGQFMDLIERQKKAEAQQAFVAAMAALKKNPPTIEKTNVADFTTQKGRTTYTYADLATVCTAVIAALAEHGISHDWSVEQPGNGQPDAGMICVTCTLTHEQGHSKSTTLKAPADPSGSKNAIQAIGSTVSYLERYSLLAACGIAVKEMGDDDGASSQPQAGENLADKWVMKAGAAATQEALQKVWADGVAEISEKNDRQAYNAFKKAVGERKQELAA